MFDRYPEYEYLLAQIQLVLFMLAMGATLTVADFASILRQPKYLLLGIAFQFVVAPLLAVLINWVGRVDAGIAVGLVLLAAMPGGAMSKLFSYLGRANIALTVSLTVCCTVASLVTVPVLLHLLAIGYAPEQFHTTVVLVVRDVALYLLAPLAAGMVVARLAPKARHGFSRWCVRIGLVFVLLMVIGSLGSGRIRPGDYGWQGPLAIILFCVAMNQAVMIPARLFGWPLPDRFAVAIEVTMRNVNLALLLKALLFPAKQGPDPIGDGVLFAVLYYAAAAMGAAVVFTLNHRRSARRLAAAAPAGAVADAPAIAGAPVPDGGDGSRVV